MHRHSPATSPSRTSPPKSSFIHSGMFTVAVWEISEEARSDAYIIQVRRRTRIDAIVGSMDSQVGS